MGERDVESLLHGLERKQFVRRERRAAVGGEAEFAFRHILVRDVAYGQIPRAERGEKHEAAARWIESLGRPEDHAELVAHHYAEALDLARAAGRETAELDGARTAGTPGRRRPRAGVERVRPRRGALPPRARALARGRRGARRRPVRPRPSARPAGTRRRGRSCGRRRQPSSRPDVPSSRPRRSSCSATSRGSQGTGRQRTSSSVVRSRSSSRCRPRARRRGSSRRRRGWRCSRRAATRRSSYGGRALELAASLGLPDVRVNALDDSRRRPRERGDATGIAELEESAALAEELNSPELPRTLNNLAGIYGTYGRVRDSDETMAAAVAAAERFGLRAIGAVRPGELALPPLSRRRLGRGARRGGRGDRRGGRERACTRLRRSRSSRGRSSSSGAANVGEAEADSVRMLEIGRVAGRSAGAHPGSREPRDRAGGDRQRRGGTAARGGAARARRRPPSSPFPVEPSSCPSRAASGVDAWLAAVGGRAPGGHRGSRRIEELLRGDPERAVDLYAALETPSDVAFARLEAAKAQLAAGRAAEARAHLEGALEFYRRVGATRYIAEAEALLAPARAESG